MARPHWRDYRCAFEWDGGLIELYVLDTSPADRDALLQHLRCAGYPVACTLGDDLATVPVDAAALFAQPEDVGRPLLVADLGGMRLNCHFFTPCRIEFDLEPREVAGEPEFDCLVAIMAAIADLRCARRPDRSPGVLRSWLWTWLRSWLHGRHRCRLGHLRQRPAPLPD